MESGARHLVRAAARNNAEWCAAVCRAHGVAAEVGHDAWVAGSRTPPHYPDAVTLVPGVDGAGLLGRIDLHAPGASVKDSFADVDLAGSGFRVLFEAQWIHRAPGAPGTPSYLRWSVVDTPARLRAWALAWDGGAGHADLFRPALLDEPGVVLVAGHSDDGDVAAGVAVMRSDDVVGVSNAFSRGAAPDAAWLVALAAVAELFPSLPVVGYDRGRDLEVARRHGFEVTGPLRVWMRDL